ncbi:hypothetical protein LTR78_001158 [Recurvomyces mirabilis]|uniref:Uncharacterized protein n=1 Tax=Recurvomyces mirabilis TaxID=574656 RepID=A0AAE1C5F1_9PEZI|nr:hypothetical protein LTR78_001158 [Recurvomyces mirabilis]KAK5161134.1 hypothetical protein LTS14_000930 [Recurvomyces mirabilis]
MPSMGTKAVIGNMANLKLRTEEDTKILPPILRLPVELRIQIYEYYIYDSTRNQTPPGNDTTAWLSPDWDKQNKNKDRSYFRRVLTEMRVLLNLCRQIREDVALLSTPMTALALDVGNKQWRTIDPKILGSVWVRVKTSDSITAAKLRVEQQVEGLIGCVVAGGKEHHFGIMYFTDKLEMGIKVFKKDVRIGLGRRILRNDLGVMRDWPADGIGKGTPVGLPTGVKVKRLIAVGDY